MFMYSQLIGKVSEISTIRESISLDFMNCANHTDLELKVAFKTIIQYKLEKLKAAHDNLITYLSDEIKELEKMSV